MNDINDWAPDAKSDARRDEINLLLSYVLGQDPAVEFHDETTLAEFFEDEDDLDKVMQHLPRGVEIDAELPLWQIVDDILSQTDDWQLD